MKFKIIPDNDISRAVYNMASGNNREYLEYVVSCMTKISKEQALSLCLDTTDGQSREYDRGFVKGFNEAAEMLVRAYMKGNEAFHQKKIPNKVVTKF